VLLYRSDLPARAPGALGGVLALEGRVSEAEMIAMNQRALPQSGERVPEEQVAFDFLRQHPYFARAELERPRLLGLAERLLRLTVQHLYLVGVSLSAAIIVAVPLGIVAAKRPALGQALLSGAGIIQTIPALALLVFLIPLFGREGIGPKPAILALFLYSLLPIMRNTFAGLKDVPLPLRESALALGLPPAARLRLVELPMAARSILAGIKTSAVINVGTATLGGLIGAGGYGEAIITGLRKADTAMILEGAIPAAVMALLVQGGFELAERKLVPRGLQLKPQT
jgi:osmoprotectant transport system permease protein